MIVIKTLKILNKILISLIIITAFFFIVGVAYSYFAADILGAETQTTLTAEAGYMNIIYEGGPNINAGGFGPSTEPFAIKNFSIKGNSTLASADIGYKLILVIDENTFTDNAISYFLNGTNPSNNGNIAKPMYERKGIGNQNITLGKGNFLGVMDNVVHNYELKLYFYETNEDQTINMEKIFKAHVSVEKYNPCVTGTCLKNAILAQGGGETAIKAKPKPDFSAINIPNGIFSADDDYGTSYYYRGDKTILNNNLLFAGFQWKIIRINGNGSIRIIYNGTEAQFTSSGTMNSTGKNTQIKEGPWNQTNINDAKYLGYMYGGANGVASTQRNGTTSAAATYNETSSNAKNELDLWYQTNIANKPFEEKIEDSIFCNDRQLRSEIGGPATGLGYGNTGEMIYAVHHRLTNTTKIPTLKCGLKNDRFTVKDTILGNGALTYPIGLISSDEADMAGVVFAWDNSINYLYTNENYWTLSPSYFHNTNYAYTQLVFPSGALNHNSVSNSRGFRPVLNLSPDVIVTGSGTSTNPFRIV